MQRTTLGLPPSGMPCRLTLRQPSLLLLAGLASSPTCKIKSKREGSFPNSSALMNNLLFKLSAFILAITQVHSAPCSLHLPIFIFLSRKDHR